MTKSTNKASPADVPETLSKGDDTTSAQTSINGQSAFHVELSPAGVIVRTVFVGEDASLHAAPLAVFNTIDTAIHQLDELKRLVIRHFGEAASAGFHAMQQAQDPAMQSSEVS